MTLTRSDARTISVDLDAAVAAVFARHGLAAKPGAVRYSSTELTFKVVGTVEGDSTETGGVNPNAAEAVEYDRYGESFGLDAGLLGTEFTSAGKRFKFVGVKASRPKFPISAVEVATGRTFKFGRSTAMLINAAGRAAP